MVFEKVIKAPPDPIFGKIEAFSKDPREEKVSLLAGVYQDETLKTESFSSIKQAREKIFSKDLVATYLPIDGLDLFTQKIKELLFGQKDLTGRVCGAQTVGGTGAIRVGAELLKNFLSHLIYIPNYTWVNHRSIFESVGMKVEPYPYYNEKTGTFDVAATTAFLEKVPYGATILFHLCCHNPSGADPSKEEWELLSKLILKKGLIPFFDAAYQGLGVDVDEDAFSVRRFLEDGHEMFVAYSCSKNFSMYSQRVGAFFAAAKGGKEKEAILSQAKKCIRSLYSNPPSHGARAVAEVLSNESLKALWLKELEKVRARTTSMRKTLLEKLSLKLKSNRFDPLKLHKGMFSFLGLSEPQVKALSDDYAIYVAGGGRINVCGITDKNIDSIVDGIVKVLS